MKMKEKDKKRHLLPALLAFTAIITAACGGGDSDETSASSGGNDGQSDESITLRLGHPAPGQSVLGRSAEAFKEEVEEKTDGKVKIDIFEGSQLGGQREMTEQIEMGTLEMGVISTPNFSNYVKDFNVLDLPFLFEDHEQAYKNLDGELGDELSKKLEDKGIKPLGYWEFGYSQIINNQHPVKSPEDMKGLKIRAQPSDLISDTFKHLGAEPVVVDSTEVYTGLQQGLLDGVNTYYFVTVDQKEYEQAKHFSELNLSYGVTTLIINKDIFESLDSELQETIVELAEKHTQLQRELSQSEMEQNKQFIQEEGVEIVEGDEIDTEAFREAVSPVYEKYGSEYQDLLDLIQE